MRSWFRQVDELLRIRMMPHEKIRELLLRLPLRRFALLIAMMAAAYGVFMGLYALSVYWGGASAGAQRCWQILASTVKLPAVFLLTLVIPLPSLYVVSAILGCPLNFSSTVRLQVAAVAVNLAVVASLGPILAFVTLNTSSYPFMVLANIFFFGVGGLAYLAFMRYTVGRLADPLQAPNGGLDPSEGDGESLSADVTADPVQESDSPGSQPEPITSHVAVTPKAIFRIWLFLYCIIGIQMSWVLRPFIGSPEMPFTWLRPREGHFFKAVFVCIQQLLGIH